MHRTSVALCALSMMCLVSTAFAQEGGWEKQADVALNLSQSTFSSNWAGGDRGSINWVLNADLKAQRTFDRVNWSNALQLAYGQTSQQKLAADGGKNWSRPDKTTDLIQLESTARYDLKKWVEPYVSLRIDSQFRDESDPLGRFLFNPLKLSETAGIARVLDKSDTSEWIARAGFGFRQNITKSFTDLTGDQSERNSSHDGGFELQSTATYPVWEGAVMYTGKFRLFWPVFYDKSDALTDFDTAAVAADPEHETVADFWKNPDLDWQNTFSAQITKYLTVNLYLQFVYDKFDQATNVDPGLPLDVLTRKVLAGIRKAGQFKQTLALGVTYRLF